MQVPGIATVTHHARAATQFAPGRPAVWLGLRIAAATALPLALAPWLHPAAATWAPLAGYGVALVDKGGAYRARATAMAMTAIGSLLAVAIGTLVAGSPLAVVVVTLGATACAFGQAWGAAGASIGNTIALHLTIAAFLPIDDGLLPAVVGFAGGAAWALLLGLVVWPVRIYKPGRRAIASVLAALADYATSLAQRSRRDELTRSHRAIRDQLEVARQVLVATRRGRRGETGRGERLLAIVHASDHMFGTLVALEEVFDAGAPAETVALLARGLETYATALRELAARVLVEHPPAPAVTPAWHPTPQADRDPRTAHALLLLARVHAERHRTNSLIDSLVADTEPVPDPLIASEPAPTIGERLRATGERLRSTIHLESAVLRHALRVAICVGLAASIAVALELHHGYWLTLTTYLLLQPNRAATTTRAIQRGAGTVLGAMIAAAIAWAIRDPLSLMVIIVVLAGLGASILHLNYALYSLFVTPTFVLLAEVHTQDFTLVEVRIVYTLLAGILAFLASAVLWPSREQVQFGEQMARAVETAGRYLGAVRTAIASGIPSPSPDILATRRAFGLAANNAESALDRVIAERTPELEPLMTMVMATRRLGAAINVFGSTRAVVAYAPHEPALTAFAHAVEDRLDELAIAIRSGTAPSAWSDVAPAIGDPTIAARLARIELQLAALAEAATRTARRDRAISELPT